LARIGEVRSNLAGDLYVLYLIITSMLTSRWFELAVPSTQVTKSVNICSLFSSSLFSASHNFLLITKLRQPEDKSYVSRRHIPAPTSLRRIPLLQYSLSKATSADMPQVLPSTGSVLWKPRAEYHESSGPSGVRVWRSSRPVCAT
jgi:hypothetical protein